MSYIISLVFVSIILVIQHKSPSAISKLKDNLIKMISSKIANGVRKFILRDNCNDNNVRSKFKSQLSMREQCKFKERRKNDKEKTL